MDQRLPDDNGIDLLREFRARRPQLVGILMTGFADVRDAVAAVREGVFDYLTKPFEDLEALEAVIGKALELDRAYREIDGLRARLAGESGAPAMIGQSPAMEQRARPDPPGRRPRHHRAAGRRKRHRQGSRRQADPCPEHARRRSPSLRSIAADCRNPCWKACCSATKRAPSPGPARPMPAISKRRMAATCSSTKSPT